MHNLAVERCLLALYIKTEGLALGLLNLISL